MGIFVDVSLTCTVPVFVFYISIAIIIAKMIRDCYPSSSNSYITACSWQQMCERSEVNDAFTV